MNIEKIKFLREELGYTQQIMANKLNIKRSTYSGYDNKIDNIPLNRFKYLCFLLKTSMDYVVDLKKTNVFINKVYTPIDKKNIGIKMKSIRTKNNHLEKDIAKILGIDVSTYSRYENGLYIIQTEYLIAFAKYYKVSIDWLCN